MPKKKTAPKKEELTGPKQEPQEQKSEKKNLFQKLRGMRTRYRVLVGAVLLLLAGVTVLSLPAPRYAVLNTIGSADASLLVTNSITDEPVKGATVTLSNGDSALSDEQGVAFFNDTEYGTTQATITKNSYSVVVVDLTISKDNVELGTFAVEPLGIPVVVNATDWLSEQPVPAFAVTSQDGESVFQSEEGSALLNIPFEAEGELMFTVSADGYNDSEVTIDTQAIDRTSDNTTSATAVSTELVFSGRHHFISNRDDNVAFYATNYDGTGTELLVSTELDLDYLNAYPVEGSSNVYAALLPSSISKQNELDKLVIIKAEEKSLEVVDEVATEDLQFSIIAVRDDLVVYRVQYDEARADQYKLKSYNLQTGKLTTYYSSADYFWPVYTPEYNDAYIVEQTNEFAYYSYGRQTSERLIQIDLDTNTKTTIESNLKLSLNGIRNEAPDKLLYNVSWAKGSKKTGYYQRDLADISQATYFKDYPETEEQEEIPDSEKGQSSPNETNRVWIDQRDGVGRLILNDSANIVSGQSSNLSVSSIIRWVDDTKLTVTVQDGAETADYLVDVEAGSFKKITNSYRSTRSRDGCCY